MVAVPFLRSASIQAEIAQAIDSISFLFQPIISTSTLGVHGFEVLSRPTVATFPSIIALLDAAHESEMLAECETRITQGALACFSTFPQWHSARLFCNIDSRIFENDQCLEAIEAIFLSQSAIPASNLCLEISERFPIRSSERVCDVTRSLIGRGMKVALDDFGVGMSGLKMLLQIEPHYIKIDRCFVSDLASSGRRQAIVAKLCGLAHALGFFTIAEGVESESDLRLARDLGCDFAQGFHIARPTASIDKLAMSYTQALSSTSNRRMSDRVTTLLSKVEPLILGNSLADAAARFKDHPELTLIPVLDRDHSVLGVVMEEDVRRYQLSDFGPSLLANKGVKLLVDQYVRKLPLGDAKATTEAMLNSYVESESACGMILTDEGRYAGYLTNHALVRLAVEREVSQARECNPLTMLSGNNAISEKIDQTLVEESKTSIVYFDFDHFKAFNDVYGFAAGDRALIMFSDLLRECSRSDHIFVGHVGGDDFFMRIDNLECAAVEELVREICQRFRGDVSALYSMEDRKRGGLKTLDRFNQERFFPILRASAAILHLPHPRGHITRQMIDAQLATGKRQAKSSLSGLATVRLPENMVHMMQEQLDSCFERI